MMADFYALLYLYAPKYTQCHRTWIAGKKLAEKSEIYKHFEIKREFILRKVLKIIV
jgi:hypothetical protein